MKILNYLKENILFVITLFLLAFIPLYPKIPLIDVQYTWVYIRIEDFLVAIAMIIWFIQFLRRKAILKSPLTIPIFVFWLVGGFATLFAVIFYFPHMADVHASTALLHFLRRIEYLSLFFVAVSSIKNKEFVKYIIATLSITLLLVCLYGFGQKLLGFPAFLTMNEEFAKGTPLTLSQAGRVASTFAGHYDLAAYLVLMASIMGSLALGAKKIYRKIGFAFLVFLSLSLLLLTTSRVSFVVWFLSMIFVLILRKTKIQKKYFLAIPVLLVLVFTTTFFSGITQRFGDTFSKAQIVIDTKTGSQLGIVKEVTDDNGHKKILIEEKQSTGEELPQGSKFISLPTSKVQKVTGTVTITKQKIINGHQTEEVVTKDGVFLIKNVFAYDVSFTTRLQGTWPRAIKAFQRNPLIGSGYSSIDVGTDGNYLRILGEVGVLGLISFLMIFVVFGIYVYRVLPLVNSNITKSFIIGIVAGVFGIGLNAILIDVFEASKIAFTLWLLMGITIGILIKYQKDKVDMKGDLIKVLTSTPSIIIFFFFAGLVVYWKSVSNYFVGDDFTWLRWSADCAKEMSVNKIMECESLGKTFIRFFTDSQGFFYRPGTKLYFFGAYTFFGLNPAPYHIISIFSHFLNTAFIFVIARKILKSKLYAFITALLFLTASTHSETVFWISSINHLLATTFLLLSVMTFMIYKDSKKTIYLLISILSIFISPLFHELGIIAPLIILACDLILYEKNPRVEYLKKWYIYPYLLQIPAYLYIRAASNSHWMQGDYTYNISALPFNFIGNLIGYKFTIFFGEWIIPIHQTLRGSFKNQELIVLVVSVVLLGIALLFFKKMFHFIKHDIKLYAFGFAIFIISLLPFLGLGNITLRYSYLAAFGFFLLLVLIARQILASLPKNLKSTGKIVALLTLTIFISYHIFSLQNASYDWEKAGKTTKNLQLKINTSNIPPNSALYFVNTPAKYGQAWVFPVGLEDALWFSAPDSNIIVRSVGSKAEAVTLTSASPNAKIFEFTKDGHVSPVKK